jgi:hypothetical protein
VTLDSCNWNESKKENEVRKKKSVARKRTEQEDEKKE